MKRPSGRHALEVEGVTKSYGETEVIRDFTASVIRGEKIALMGRNGAGKTTLLIPCSRIAGGPDDDAQISGYDGALSMRKSHLGPRSFGRIFPARPSLADPERQ